ncbi:AraC family transcriptional regulator [Caldicellulosiruptoraceae bacterium PP1]
MNQVFLVTTGLEQKLPIILKGIGTRDSQEKVYRKEGFPDYHYLHTLSGKGFFIVDNKKYIIDENMGFFLFPNVPHEYYPIENNWSTIWLTFNGPAVNEVLKSLEIKSYEVFSLPNKSLLESIMQAISNKYYSANYYVSLECSQLVYNFILNLAMAIQNGVDNNFESNYVRLSPILKFIDENYKLELSLEDLSKIVQLSPQHLCNLFKKTFKITPYEYLIRVRIQKAKEMLIKNDYSQVKEICYDVGFKNISYFCYVFKKLEGVTPSQFKKLFL